MKHAALQFAIVALLACVPAKAGQVVPDRDRTAKLEAIARLMDRENPDVAAGLEGLRDPFLVDETPVITPEQSEADAAELEQNNHRAVLLVAAERFRVKGVLAGADRVFLACADGETLVVGGVYPIDLKGTTMDVTVESAGAESYVIRCGEERIEVPFVQKQDSQPGAK
jgi:hypothetical protein